MPDPIPLFNARISAEDEAARLRQEVTDSLHRALTGAIDGARNIPVFLKEAFEREVWKRERIFAGGTVQPPISFHEYVHANYPVGLGTDFDTLRGFITRDIELLAAYDRACQRGDGGANNPYGRAGKPGPDEKTTVDNIHGDFGEAPDRPTGTSRQAGLRRLEKAAAADPKARDLHEQVLRGEVSVNAAGKELGWRKSYALAALKRAWKQATFEEREVFRAWIDDEESPLSRSRFQ